MPEGTESVEMTVEQKIRQLTMHHAPNEEGIAAITNIREATFFLIATIMRNCPASADRSAAIRKAREAMMTANASIVVPQVQL